MIKLLEYCVLLLDVPLDILLGCSANCRSAKREMYLAKAAATMHSKLQTLCQRVRMILAWTVVVHTTHAEAISLCITLSMALRAS